MFSILNLKKVLFGLIFISIISIIFLLSAGCDMLEEAISITGEQGETSYDSVETEAVNEQEESVEESGKEEAEDIQVETETATETSQKEVSEATDQETSITIHVYYVDEQAQFLIGEEREITGRNKAELIVAAFNELLKAPERQDTYNLIPQGTEIINAEFIDNYAFVNLSPEFVDNKSGDGLADFLVVNCIAATMTEIPDVNGVIFKVNWEDIDLYGDIDLSVPVTRNEGLIKE